MESAKKIDKRLSILALTWPIFIELMLQLLVNNIDQLMLSRVSDNAVAAVGNVNQIMNVLVITFSVITMATTILVSQYLGAKDYSKVSETYTVSIFTNLIFGLAAGTVLFMSGGTIFKLIKLPTDLLQDANAYMNIVGGGLFLQALFLTYSAIFRSNMSGGTIFKLIKLPTDLLQDANAYMNIVGGGLFLQALFLTYSAIFRSNGFVVFNLFSNI